MQIGDVAASRGADGRYELLEITGVDPVAHRHLGSTGDRASAMRAVSALAELEWIDAWLFEDGETRLIARHRYTRNVPPGRG